MLIGPLDNVKLRKPSMFTQAMVVLEGEAFFTRFSVLFFEDAFITFNPTIFGLSVFPLRQREFLVKPLSLSSYG